MTRTSILGLALLVLSLPATPVRAAYRIHGWVVAPEPSAARIEISQGEHSETAVRPRTDGSFEAAVAQPGIYRIVLRGEGLLSLEIPLLPVVEDVELPPAVPAPASPLEIQVTDRDGRPAAGVTVCARSLDSAEEATPWVAAERCGRTAGRGRLNLPRGADERLALCASDPRFTARRVEWGDDAAVTLGLQPARTVFVEVRSPDGKPAAGARARLLCAAESTDPAGRVAVGVPASGADIQFTTPDGLTAHTVFLPGESDARTVTLHLPGSLSGRILDAAARRPLPGALVWSGDVSARTALDGTFRLPIVAGPELLLSAAAAGYAQRRIPLQRSAANVTLALPPGSVRWDPQAFPEAAPGWEHQPDEHTGVLAGRVLAPDGRPVSGAWVEAARRAAESDDAGRFRIAGLVPGATLDLSVQASGLRGGLSAVPVPPEGKPSRLEIRLGRAAALDGRLTDAAGRPLAGAFVTLQEPPSPRAVTDDDGRFRLDSLAPGRREAVALRAGGRPLARAAVDLQPGANRLDLTAAPGFPVSGRVVDERGAPVPAARLFLEGEDPEDRWLAVGAGDGTFLLSGIREGDYRLSVLAAGFAQPEPQPVRIADKPVRGLTLRVGRNGSIVGSLLGLTPQELNGLVIRAQAAGSQRLGLAGPDRRYLISDVPAGRWEVTVQTATGRQALGAVDVKPGSPAALDLRLTSGLTLKGRLRIDGQPAAGTLLAAAADLQGESRGGQSPVGPGGAFMLPGLMPGSYLLLVLLDGFLWPIETVELTADREISLEIATGTVTGRILGPFGAPLAGAQIALWPRAPGVDAFLPSPLVRSDSQGSFTLPHIPAGNHRLLVTHDGTVPFAASVDVPAGGTVRIEIPLLSQN
jgi:protocatechuate 3,4-dioxygenase beta subunit